MNKYLLFLMAISLPNISMAAESDSSSDGASDSGSSLFSLSDDGSEVSTISTASSAIEMMKEQQREETFELAELIKENINSFSVLKHGEMPFVRLNKILMERHAIRESTYIKAVTVDTTVEDASLVVAYYDNTDVIKSLLAEISGKMKPGAKLLVICKKRLNSETKLATPGGLKRTLTMKRFYGLPVRPEHRHIVLFEKSES